MMSHRDSISAYEAPRIVSLGPHLHAACFMLMKLLPARFMLDRAEERGALRPNGTVVETTSGTFGLALAMLSANRHYRLHLVTADSLIDRPFRRRLEQLGATVSVLADPEGSGDQKGRLSKLNEILERDSTAFWPNQYDNPDNPLAYGALAEQLIRKCGRIDLLVGCVGSGGSLCGTASYLKMAFPDLRVVAVDTHGSVLFGQKLGPRSLRGLGNSLIPGNLDHTQIDEVHWMGATHAWNAARDLYRKHGIYMGPTSGAAVLVAKWLASQLSGSTVAVLLADEGHRYANTVYNYRPTRTEPSCIGSSTGPVTISEIRRGDVTEWLRMDWRRRSLNDVSIRNPGN